MHTADITTTAPTGTRLLVAAAAALALSMSIAASAGGPMLDPAPMHAPAASAPAPIVPNAGQIDAPVRFQASGRGAAVFFTPREIVLTRPAGALRLRFVGADPGSAIVPGERTPGVVNDLRGADPSRWRTGLPVYGSVVYRGLHPGVDLRVEVDASATPQRRYSIASGASADSVRWRYAHPTTTRVDGGSGELVVASRAGVLREAAPVAWQLVDGSRVAVDAEYRVASDGSVGFGLGHHDRGAPLVVTVPSHGRAAQARPPAIRHSTFLGGARWDEAYDAAVDRAGNAYVAGLTFSPEFPRTGARRSGFRGVVDGFVSKLDLSGRLVYSSYLGGTATDYAHGVAVDRRGNAYVTGRTESPDFPLRRAMKRRLGRSCQGRPCHDAFVTKLGRSGRIVYSTFLGGTNNEEAWDIAVDRRGRAHVIGNTDSSDFPLRRAVQRDNRSRPCHRDVPCPFDSFVAKLRRNGRGLVYSTYLGGRRTELASGIAVDRRGAAYVVGTTDSPNFPRRRALQRSIRGRECGPPPNVPCEEAFVAKLRPRGRRLVWSTFLGGTKSEHGSAIAVDRRGRTYIAGFTDSSDFPTAAPVQPAIDNGSCSPEAPPKEICHDGFVSGLTRNGRRLRFSTYLGGNGEDQARAVGVDRTGAVYAAGSTDSRRFPISNALQPALAAAIDGFVTKFAPGGRSIVYSTYLGGAKNERVNGLAVTSALDVVLTGRTDSPNFPVVNPQQPVLRGDIDAFVTRLR